MSLEPKKRILIVLFGLVLGCISGFVLNLIWFLFRFLLLGYGDRGPEWIITVNRSIWVFSISMGLIGSQVYHHFRKRKQGQPG